MKVFVTGGTGFVGGFILRRLLDDGHEVVALARPDSERGVAHLPDGVQTARADVLGPDLSDQMEGVDAVIHLVGIIREYPRRGVTFRSLHVEATQNVVRAMEKAGVKRLVHMSALGAGPEGATDYFATKWEAEKAVKESGLEWTVMKPSVIFGPGDEFVNMLAGQVRLAPVVPVMGDGRYQMQPVSAADVAEGFVKSLSMPESAGKSFEVGGPDRLTYLEIIDAIGAALGKGPRPKLRFPLWLMGPIIRMMGGFDFFPVTEGQLKMLLMSNVCDPGPYFEFFNISPKPFRQGIREYLAP